MYIYNMYIYDMYIYDVYIYMICIYIWYVYIYDMYIYIYIWYVYIYIWYVYIYLRIIFVFVTPTETNSRIGQGGDGGMALVPGRRGDWFWRKSVRMRDGTSIVKGSIRWYKFVWFVLFTSSMYEYSMHTLGKTMQRLGCFGVRTSSDISGRFRNHICKGCPCVKSAIDWSTCQLQFHFGVKIVRYMQSEAFCLDKKCDGPKSEGTQMVHCIHNVSTSVLPCASPYFSTWFVAEAAKFMSTQKLIPSPFVSAENPQFLDTTAVPCQKKPAFLRSDSAPKRRGKSMEGVDEWGWIRMNEDGRMMY